MMKAVRVSSFGGPEVLQVLKGVAIPKPSSKEVVPASFYGVSFPTSSSLMFEIAHTKCDNRKDFVVLINHSYHLSSYFFAAFAD